MEGVGVMNGFQMGQTVVAKLTGIFVALIVVIVVVAGIVFYQTSRLMDSVSHNSNYAKFESVATETYLYFLKMDDQTNMWMGLYRYNNPSLVSSTLAQTLRYEQHLMSDAKKLTALSITPEQKKATANLEANVLAYDHYFQLAKQYYKTNHNMAAQSVFINNANVSNTLNSQLEKLLSFAQSSVINESIGLITQLRTTSIIAYLVIILIAVGMIFYIRRLLRPIASITQNLLKIANQDLRVEPLPVKSKDEIGDLIQSTNMMADNLRKLVRQLQTSSEQLSASSEETAASTEETAVSVNEIANQMQNVTELSNDGTNTVLDISQALLKLSSLIQIAKMKANSASSITEQTRDAASHGKQTVDKTIQSIQEIKQKTNETEQRMAELQQYSKQIEQIASTISEIAEQTNLLALNASIEAARAGEQGKGFAVVAEEVRKLAEQTREESSRVGGILSHILTVSDASVTVTQESQKAVATGVEMAQQSGQALEKILQAVSQTVEEVKGIDQVTQDEVANSDQIVALIKTVADVVEKTADSAQSVAAATEQISAAMQTISASTQESNQQAVRLNDLMTEFQMQ